MAIAIFVVVPGEGGTGSGGPSPLRPSPAFSDPAPLPGDELHEVVVERDAGFSIEDGRVGVADKVRRDNLGVRISEVSLGRRAKTSRSPGSDSGILAMRSSTVSDGVPLCPGCGDGI